MFAGLPPLTCEDHDLHWGTCEGPARCEWAEGSDGVTRWIITHLEDRTGWTLVWVSSNTSDTVPFLWARRKDGMPVMPVGMWTKWLVAECARLQGDLAAARETIAEQDGRLQAFGVPK